MLSSSPTPLTRESCRYTELIAMRRVPAGGGAKKKGPAGGGEGDRGDDSSVNVGGAATEGADSASRVGIKGVDESDGGRSKLHPSSAAEL